MQTLPIQIDNAVELFGLIRDWWPHGRDVLVFWRTCRGTAQRFCSASGESTLWCGDRRPLPQLVASGEVEQAEYAGVRQFLLESGIMDRVDQRMAITSAHAVDTYFVKLIDGSSNVFRIPGMYACDQNVDAIRQLFDGPVGFQKFYNGQEPEAE